jgi:ribosomal protein S18 acetylase RimI-like enzyme
LWRKYAGGVEFRIRPARPADYGRIFPLVNEWWSGRDVARLLPKVFFVHFEGTSFVAETEDGRLAGFVCGFFSQTNPQEAYVHMAAVDPALRRQGCARRLYERFIQAAREHGCKTIHCVTQPTNQDSVAFHEAMGFHVERLLEDYAGPGDHRLLFAKALD